MIRRLLEMGLIWPKGAAAPVPNKDARLPDAMDTSEFSPMNWLMPYKQNQAEAIALALRAATSVREIDENKDGIFVEFEGFVDEPQFYPITAEACALMSLRAEQVPGCRNQSEVLLFVSALLGDSRSCEAFSNLLLKDPEHFWTVPSQHQALNIDLSEVSHGMLVLRDVASHCDGFLSCDQPGWRLDVFQGLRVRWSDIGRILYDLGVESWTTSYYKPAVPRSHTLLPKPAFDDEAQEAGTVETTVKNDAGVSASARPAGIIINDFFRDLEAALTAAGTVPTDEPRRGMTASKARPILDKLIAFKKECDEADVRALRSKPPVGPKQAAAPDGAVSVEQTGGLQVLSEIGDPMSEDGIKAKRRYGSLLYPLRISSIEMTADDVLDRLNAEFPWMTAANYEITAAVAMSRAGNGRFFSKPLLLDGPPGIGKTRWSRRVAEILGTGWGWHSLAGAHNSMSISGSERGWSSARPCFVADILLAAKTANPIILLDEVDKTGRGSHNGDPLAALLPLLTRDTAARFKDNYLLAEMDLSMVTWIMTSNEGKHLPTPLLQRLSFIACQPPASAYIPDIIGAISREIADSYGIPHGLIPPLDIDALVAFYVKQRDLRSLSRQVERRFCQAIWASGLAPLWPEDVLPGQRKIGFESG